MLFRSLKCLPHDVTCVPFRVQGEGPNHSGLKPEVLKNQAATCWAYLVGGLELCFQSEVLQIVLTTCSRAPWGAW